MPPSHSVLTAAAVSGQEVAGGALSVGFVSSLVDLTAGGGPGSICPEVVEDCAEPEGVGGSTTMRRFTRMNKSCEISISKFTFDLGTF